MVMADPPPLRVPFPKGDQTTLKVIGSMTKTKLYQIIGSKPCARHMCGNGTVTLRLNGDKVD